MNTIRIFFLLSISLVYIFPDKALGGDTPADIIAALPRMCWGQYIESAKNNPDYLIQDCGAFANHFCPGLVHMARAERGKSFSQKVNELNMAKADMQYTLFYTEEYPECILRPLAKKNLININSQLEILNIQQRNQRR